LISSKLADLNRRKMSPKQAALHEMPGSGAPVRKAERYGDPGQADEGIQTGPDRLRVQAYRIDIR
jgi:hypothetical protein